jgi:predicted O-methyltransferase YrrM
MHYNFDTGDKFFKKEGEKDYDEEIVDLALDFLKKEGCIESDFGYDKEVYSKFRDKIKSSFNLPWTAFSPSMERFLYALVSAKKPKKMVVFGIYCGYNLIWNAGPTMGKHKVYQADKIYGIDIDSKVIGIAENNFNNFELNTNVKMIGEDGISFAEKTDEEFDYVFIDVYDQSIGKDLYFDIAKKVYKKLKKGGWMLAHDATCYAFERQMRNYLDFVREEKFFSKSYSFPIDKWGLELSIK